MVDLFSKKAGDIIWFIGNKNIKFGEIVGVKIKDDGEYYIVKTKSTELDVHLSDCFNSEYDATINKNIRKYIS